VGSRYGVLRGKAVAGKLAGKAALSDPHPGRRGDKGPDLKKEPAPSRISIIAALVNPAGADAGRETVTLLNLTPGPVDLSGWSIGF
jgi:hypothetical protein